MVKISRQYFCDAIMNVLQINSNAILIVNITKYHKSIRLWKNLLKNDILVRFH